MTYYGLRDYGTATWDGGDPACNHSQVMGGPSAKQMSSFGTRCYQFKRECRRCGAQRIDRQIGLEETPDAYIAELVAVFKEARRVLRDQGTLWINIGDSYAGGGGGNYGNSKTVQYNNNNPSLLTNAKKLGLKPKDIIGIPWMLAFALRADGWWLRDAIIWAKPSPMPESVTDRCTKSHEYVFMLSKRRTYWYDAKAVAEPATYIRSKKSKATVKTRNRRSVWTIPPEPNSLDHFATMPTELAELCIKAGCPTNGTVLDPFGGAGTTPMVADRLGRNAISIELNPNNTIITQNRISQDAGLFAEITNTEP